MILHEIIYILLFTHTRVGFWNFTLCAII